MKSLMWFRNDLRTDDNPALKNACIESDEVHAIYIYSSKQNDLHNEANCKIQFIIENLKDLEQTLSKINIPLTIINSVDFNDNLHIIFDLIKERSFNKVFFNNQFGNDEKKRDEQIISSFNKNAIEFSSYDEKVIYPPGFIRTGEDKPYSVFTPFKKKWIENFNLDLLDIEFKYLTKKKSVIESIDTGSIYNLPILFKKQELDLEVLKKLNINKYDKPNLRKWNSFLNCHHLTL